MKFEVVENAGAWIVRRDGAEVGRFPEQDAALNHVASEFRDANDTEAAASLAVRYERRRA